MKMMESLLLNVELTLLIASFFLLFHSTKAQDLPNFFNKISNFSVTSNVPLTITALPSTDYSVFPNGVTIQPIGKTSVIFTICALVQNITLTNIPVTLMVPMTTYLGFPITGPASKTIDITPGQKVAVSGVGGHITRLFYGVSWQYFPQLSGVTIANKTWIWRWPPVPPNVTVVQPYQAPLWTPFDSFSVPPLVCT